MSIIKSIRLIINVIEVISEAKQIQYELEENFASIDIGLNT
ncbi:hypothetical protein [Okeania sp. SIO2C2]|nr:hypothetical protein [Okeania sp. SIO2C2]